MARRDVSLSNLVRRDKLNINTLVDLLVEYSYCEACKIKEKELNGTRCNDCIYVVNSILDNMKKEKSKRRIRVGCSREIFTPLLGISRKDVAHVGKTNLVYFKNHPELEWSMPPIPVPDYFGDYPNENSRWDMHHYKDPYDDTHVVRVTNKEHATFEAMARRGDFDWLNHLLKTRERHPSLDPGWVIPSRKEYYKLWKKNSNGVYVRR